MRWRPENAGSGASTESESSRSTSSIRLLIGLRHVAKRIAAQDFVDALRRRLGIEHQVALGLGRGVVAEGVVQQVVENLAVQLGLALVVGFESRRAPAASCAVGIAQPNGDLAQLVADREAAGAFADRT